MFGKLRYNNFFRTAGAGLLALCFFWLPIAAHGQCGALTADDIISFGNGSKITFAWTDVGAVAYRFSGRLLPNGTMRTIVVTGTSFTVNNVQVCKDFEYTIETLCNGTTVSFTSSGIVRTGGCGIAPTDIALFESNSKVYARWPESSPSNYELIYSVAGSLPRVIFTNSSTTELPGASACDPVELVSLSAIVPIAETTKSLPLASNINIPAPCNGSGGNGGSSGTCTGPSVSASVSGSDITLNWTGNAPSYNLSLTKPFPAENIYVENYSGSTYSFRDLACGDYGYSVVANCSNGDRPSDGGSVSVTGANSSNCGAPSGVQVFTGNGNVSLRWNPTGASNNSVALILQGSGNSSFNRIESVGCATSFSASGLVCGTYDYQVVANCPGGNAISSGTFTISGCASKDEAHQPNPTRLAVELTVVPQPANDHVTLQLATETAVKADLALYNLQGQRIRSLLQATQMSPGTHALPVDCTDLANGVYFLKLQTEGGLVTRRLVIQH
ncbi:MAG: T9SS type A sorting domain-containing protein [Bacteroidota bacterium]